MADLASAIANGRETTSVDFKERLNWRSGRAAQIATLRDIVALANREGGSIVIGAQDQRDGSFRFPGLLDDDPLPDPTEVGALLAQYFDPAVSVTVGPREDGGLRFGVFDVSRFTVSPHIAIKDAHDERGNSLLADGDLLIRTDSLTTERVKGRDLRALLDRATLTRASRFATLLPPKEAPSAPSPFWISPVEEPWGESVSGSRLLELRPSRPQPSLSLRDVEALVKEASVVSRTGQVFMPPDLAVDRYGTRLIREPGRVILQASVGAEGIENEGVSTAEITTNLLVRVREVPWERHVSWGQPEPDSPRPIDISGLLVWITAGTLFARRLYSAAGAPRFHYRVGIATPAGHRLQVNTRRFISLHEAYVGTSRTTIWVDREADVENLAEESARLEFSRSVFDELVYYFGLTLQDSAFEAQVKYVKELGGASI